MNIAFIPPASFLHMIDGKPLHMCIPEGYRTSTLYRDWYQTIGMKPGTTLMLDNGAYEGVGGMSMSNEALINLTHETDADIVVLPDKLCDLNVTLDRSRAFLHTWSLHEASVELDRIPTFLGALQGADTKQLKDCLAGYQALEDEFEIEIMIGLSRWMTDEINVQIRYRLATFITEHAPHRIHLLGYNKMWAEEIVTIAQDIPLVESIDTGAPWVYAMDECLVGQVGIHPKRPPNYFTYDYRHVYEPTVRRNMETMEAWARGED